jgi:hypothetical protein
MTGPKMVRYKPKPEEVEEVWKSISEVYYPNIPLQVSRVVFREDGTAMVEGTLTLEHPVTFLQTNLTIESEHGSLVVEDVPTEFERVLPEEKKL